MARKLVIVPTINEVDIKAAADGMAICMYANISKYTAKFTMSNYTQLELLSIISIDRHYSYLIRRYLIKIKRS